MVSTYYKISLKSQGNNSLNSFFFSVCKQITMSEIEIYLIKGAKSSSAEMEIVWPSSWSYVNKQWKTKGNHSVKWWFVEKNPRVFERLLFSENSLKKLVRKSKITGTPAENVDIYSVLHRSVSDPFLPTNLVRMSELRRYSKQTLSNIGSKSDEVRHSNVILT